MDLDYHPQTVPFQPMLENASFLSTIKLCPEEWTQLPISTADTPELDGLICDVSGGNLLTAGAVIC